MTGFCGGGERGFGAGGGVAAENGCMNAAGACALMVATTCPGASGGAGQPSAPTSFGENIEARVGHEMRMDEPQGI